MSYLSTAPAGGAGSGTVTQVNTGTGLTGGPITATGTISLSTALAPMATLTGNSLKLLRVNVGETAVEYFTASLSPGGSSTQLQYNSSGAFGGITNVLTNGVSLGLRTAAPTHDLTFASTSNGLALYNTVDQTTNYERVKWLWTGNILTMTAEKGGTGVDRLWNFSNAGTILQIGTGNVIVDRSTASTNSGFFKFTGTLSQASGSFVPWAITPTMTQSSTAGYTMLLINPNDTSNTGSGQRLLIDAQVTLQV